MSGTGLSIRDAEANKLHFMRLTVGWQARSHRHQQQNRHTVVIARETRTFEKEYCGGPFCGVRKTAHVCICVCIYVHV